MKNYYKIIDDKTGNYYTEWGLNRPNRKAILFKSHDDAQKVLDRIVREERKTKARFNKRGATYKPPALRIVKVNSHHTHRKIRWLDKYTTSHVWQ